ncbi:ABC transporter ATP-binding protein [Amycolatopsis rubida]|uniref:NitT/TauT family transport system ATP-binding protein n=1 Tax=Amycolatopsis rubida TaxID=112413 RepID=A0A1I5V5N3_9PSEU|nr:ABC transporter ATP-binding protein [Amycolatopsis rubida]SFQ02692.1 NitT/TauT family transport system ATP-binding protein [Amycolatopsis rubida]
MSPSPSPADRADPADPVALRLAGVSLTFPGRDEPVVDGLDLDVRTGEFLAVIGPSGSGKTTLLRLAHGLLRPDRGLITAGAEHIVKPSTSRGFVFQSDCLLPWRRIVDNVAFPLELAGAARAAARTKAMELLELTGLAASANQYPAQLSGGMRQRVNLARALAIDPEVLLMDEPFAALDAQTREVLQTELLTIWARDRKTVLFVTHQLDEAVFLADRVVVLQPNPGRVREIVPIALPRPRALEIKRTAEFNGLVDRLWHLIKSDVLAEQLI